jgi:hypothetical protein
LALALERGRRYGWLPGGAGLPDDLLPEHDEQGEDPSEDAEDQENSPDDEQHIIDDDHLLEHLGGEPASLGTRLRSQPKDPEGISDVPPVNTHVAPARLRFRLYHPLNSSPDGPYMPGTGMSFRRR